jgi:histidinol-phosphate phosphatase family protein
VTKQALVLCGGLGTRLGGLVTDVPKPMLPLEGRPLLAHSIDCLARAGIDDVVLAAGYKADVIRNHFSGWHGDVRVRVFAESQPLGTAGPARWLESELADTFLVLYGDVFIDLDLRGLLEAHARHIPAATLLVRPSDHPWDSDLVQLDAHDVITGFIPAGAAREFPRNVANAAIYVIDRRLTDTIPGDRPCDWVRDVCPAALAAGMTLRAHWFSGEGFLKDMGTPERLALVGRHLEERRMVERARAAPAPVRTVFLDRDGVINEELDLLTTPDEFRLLPGAAEAVARLNAAGMTVIVVTNQSVVARGLCSPAGLEAIHDRMRERLALAGARVDAVYFCPHHPETHHRDGGDPALRVACNCRKPAPGMLLRAAREHDIDLAAAVMVGDRVTDVLAARRAGVRSILVGSRPLSPTDPRPDARADSLSEAVDLLLASPPGPAA